MADGGRSKEDSRKWLDLDANVLLTSREKAKGPTKVKVNNIGRGQNLTSCNYLW